MITVITGLPGNGKTLYALFYVKAYAEKENRDVYYSGIKDLKLPWTEFKPEEWPSLPPGAIIVIDEAQFVFPKKPNGSKLPEWYEKLAVHRHSGFDIFIITQHPSLVDNFVRQLCGRHLHVIRKFGMQRANIWEWAAANVSPQTAASHKTAILHKWKYPKAVYEYYKSAEVHTVKRSIPVKLVLACLFVVSVFAFGAYVLHRYKDKAQKHQEAVVGGVAEAGGVGAAGTGGAAVKASYKNAMDDAKQFVFDHTPRVVGLPQTAPRYDEITKPTTAPVPVACVANKYRCSCFTQQSTPMNVPDLLCRDIVARGYFVDFDDKGGHGQQVQVGGVVNAGAVPVNASKPVAEAVKSPGSSVVSFETEDGYGVLGRRGGNLPKSVVGK